jgi:type II secretory pathway pseudopilin PulG
MTYYHLHKRGGCRVAFSLIELMTTIVITGVLATVGLPEYKRYKRKARAVDSYQMLHSIENAQHTYHLEYGTFLFLKSSTSVTARENMLANIPITVDGGESADQQGNWNALGPVFPMGAKLQVYHVSNMGKFLTTGTAATFGTTWSRGPRTRPLFRAYDEFETTIDAGGRPFFCVGEEATLAFDARDFGAIGAPGRAYDWVMMSTLGMFGTSGEDCYTIARLMTYDSANGRGYRKRGFMVFTNWDWD